MKTFLVVAAVLGLTSSAAFAECAGHKVTASNEVDKEMTTASIAKSARLEEIKPTGQTSQPGDQDQKTAQ